MEIKIAPSILSADFSRMAHEVATLGPCGADLVHCDVMDGHFVPNITFGPKMIADIRSATRLPLDVHLMISDPGRYLPAFLKAGADIVTFHAEVCPDPRPLFDAIHAAGAKAGYVLNPATPLSVLDGGILEACDMVLLMSVNPGFGGQSFIETTARKIADLRARIVASGKAIDLEIDGGVTLENAARIRFLGANVIVAGSAVFGASDRAAAIAALRG